jgi:hypothetical protein
LLRHRLIIAPIGVQRQALLTERLRRKFISSSRSLTRRTRATIVEGYEPDIEPVRTEL